MNQGLVATKTGRVETRRYEEESRRWTFGGEHKMCRSLCPVPAPPESTYHRGSMGQPGDINDSSTGSHPASFFNCPDAEQKNLTGRDGVTEGRSTLNK